MSKRARSPVLGYNHNLRYGGRVFHVQTEDSGTGYARLYTHLFFEGTILSSKKEEYQPEMSEDAVRALMQKLHKAMIRELTRGEHDTRISAFFTARGEPAMLAPTAAQAAGGQAAPAVVMEAAPPAEAAAAVEVVPAPVAAVNGAAVVVVTPVAAPRTPSPLVNTTPKPVVIVQPTTTLKRSPVSVSSAADGVVVRRNVVVDVGAGQPPVQGTASAAAAAAAARPPAREPNAFVAGARSRPAAAEAAPQQPLASSREVRMPWETAAARRPVQPGAPTAVMPVVEQTAPLSSGKLRMPWDAPGAGAPALISDKSLDEVILEYLADDQDSGG